jgi:hypothetical protein
MDPVKERIKVSSYLVHLSRNVCTCTSLFVWSVVDGTEIRQRNLVGDERDFLPQHNLNPSAHLS